MIDESMYTAKLKCVMTSPVITVSEGEDVHAVQDKFVTHDIRHLPVVDHSGRIVGLISQRHLHNIHSPILKNVMVREPYVLTPDNNIKEAMEAMRNFKFGCIPIVDDQHKPVGIVTRETVMNFFCGWPKRARAV